MRISRLRLVNFKSFQDIDITLRSFNVVIGPNASGKSNLVKAFQFLKDIFENGLENAVSMQGGIDFLPNVSADPDAVMRISFDCESDAGEFVPILLYIPDHYLASNIHTEYTLDLEFNASDYGYRNVNEELHQSFELYEMTPALTDNKRSEESRGLFGPKLGRGEVTAKLVNGVPKITHDEFHPEQDSTPIEISSLIRSIFNSDDKIPPNQSLLETHQVRLISTHDTVMRGMSIYDLDPRLPKRGSLITGKADLESDGSNLAIVLNDITRDEEKNRTFHNLLVDLLPFVENMSVDRFADNSLLVNLRESYAPHRAMPASLLSDGTIGIAAIIIALAFENNEITILEEPDRNVHPLLISRLTAFMKDMQNTSQILITTHNPEFVRHADIEDLILVKRDARGFSQVSRPAESEVVRMFLDEELGIRDLYLDGMLTVG